MRILPYLACLAFLVPSVVRGALLSSSSRIEVEEISLDYQSETSASHLHSPNQDNSTTLYWDFSETYINYTNLANISQQLLLHPQTTNLTLIMSNKEEL